MFELLNKQMQSVQESLDKQLKINKMKAIIRANELAEEDFEISFDGELYHITGSVAVPSLERYFEVHQIKGEIYFK